MDIDAALAKVALPIVPIALGRRREQLHGSSLQYHEAFHPLARRQPDDGLRRRRGLNCGMRGVHKAVRRDAMSFFRIARENLPRTRRILALANELRQASEY